MSGGSFDYLYSKGSLDSLTSTYELGQMVQQIEEWSPASLALQDAKQYQAEIEDIIKRISDLSRYNKLMKVFHDVEWAVSHDITQEDAIKTILDYDTTAASNSTP